MRIIHPIDPVYNEKSKILILGSFPSVKSREPMFFYGYKQNRFWKVLAAIFQDNLPVEVEEKRAFLLSNIKQNTPTSTPYFAKRWVIHLII